MNLFAHAMQKQLKKEAPLADRMRPETLEEFIGQQDAVGEGSVLRSLIDQDHVPSMILWGPPGTGKTTLSRLIAKMTKSRFVSLSAVASGIAELRQVITEAEERLGMHNTRTIVFVDEIHRWNKSQQDVFLPYVENGTIILIGATTENPSFEINAALLSRCRVFILQRLEVDAITTLLERAVGDVRRGFGSRSLQVERDALQFIAEMADGDARAALTTLDLAVSTLQQANSNASTLVETTVNVLHLTREMVAKILKRPHLFYDKTGEQHYNIISALHKSMRGSDPDAALYWLGRMLEAGEDPLYVARRLVRFASEDIGLADPQALVQATAAFQAAHQLGMPECNVCLAQAVVYLARAPKSNALYVAYGAVQRDIAETSNEFVPLHLRNAPTLLMKELGYGKEYIYPPDAQGNVKQDYLPQKLRGKKYL